MGQKKEVLEEVMNELLDEMTLGLCFELHRSCKIGTLFLDDMDTESEKMFELVTQKGRDVFGQQVNSKKQFDCVCPHCKHSLAASRFAPHLEKCLGMGGTGPRLSSRRTAVRASKRPSDIESEDNSEDDDWSYSDKKAKKSKKDRKSHSPKKSKHKSKQRDNDDSDVPRSQSELKTDRFQQPLWDRGSSSPADSSSTVASIKSSVKNNHSSSMSVKKKKKSSSELT